MRHPKSCNLQLLFVSHLRASKTHETGASGHVVATVTGKKPTGAIPPVGMAFDITLVFRAIKTIV